MDELPFGPFGMKLIEWNAYNKGYNRGFLKGFFYGIIVAMILAFTIWVIIHNA